MESQKSKTDIRKTESQKSEASCQKSKVGNQKQISERRKSVRFCAREQTDEELNNYCAISYGNAAVQLYI